MRIIFHNFGHWEGMDNCHVLCKWQLRYDIGKEGLHNISIWEHTTGLLLSGFIKCVLGKNDGGHGMVNLA